MLGNGTSVPASREALGLVFSGIMDFIRDPCDNIAGRLLGVEVEAVHLVVGYFGKVRA